MHLKLLPVIFLIIFSSTSLAFGPFHFDLHGSLGRGSARFEDTEKGKPITSQLGGGATLGLKFGLFFYLGASFDYYKMIQNSDANSTWGNRKGTRTNIASPTIGFLFGNLHVKADYQLIGKYTLDKHNSSGNAVYYNSPKGYRFYLGYKFFTTSELGLFYEKILYKKESVGSTESTLASGSRMEVSQLGLMMTVPF